MPRETTIQAANLIPEESNLPARIESRRLRHQRVVETLHRLLQEGKQAEAWRLLAQLPNSVYTNEEARRRRDALLNVAGQLLNGQRFRPGDEIGIGWNDPAAAGLPRTRRYITASPELLDAARRLGEGWQIRDRDEGRILAGGVPYHGPDSAELELVGQTEPAPDPQEL